MKRVVSFSSGFFIRRWFSSRGRLFRDRLLEVGFSRVVSLRWIIGNGFL